MISIAQNKKFTRFPGRVCPQFGLSHAILTLLLGLLLGSRQASGGDGISSEPGITK